MIMKMFVIGVIAVVVVTDVFVVFLRLKTVSSHSMNK